MRRCSRRFLGRHHLASKYGKDGNWTPRLRRRSCPRTCGRAFRNRWRRALLPDRLFLFRRKRSARLHCLRRHFRRVRRRHSVGDRRTYGWCIRGCERWRGEVCERRSDDGWRAFGFLRRRLAFWGRDISLALDGTLLRYVHLWSEIVGRTGRLLWTRALALRLDRLLENLAPVNEMIAQRQLSRREPDW